MRGCVFVEIKTCGNNVHIAGRVSVSRQLRILVSQLQFLDFMSVSEVFDSRNINEFR